MVAGKFLFQCFSLNLGFIQSSLFRRTLSVDAEGDGRCEEDRRERTDHYAENEVMIVRVNVLLIESLNRRSVSRVG